MTDRPRTRADCEPGGRLYQRPCPWVSCRHHLAIEVSGTGGIISNRIDEGRDGRKSALPVWENDRTAERFSDAVVDALDTMPETCSLDVADRGGVTLHEAGEVLGFCRERSRQIEAKALRKIQSQSHREHRLLKEFKR